MYQPILGTVMTQTHNFYYSQVHTQTKHSLTYLQDSIPTLTDVKTHQPKQGLNLVASCAG